MSEEEIINIVENFLNYKIEKYLSGVEVCAISNLLDLYQNEKEKNKILEANGFRNGLYEVDGNYISKDKIKAKIEELNEILKNNLHITFERYGPPEHCLIYGIQILQELMKEG